MCSGRRVDVAADNLHDRLFERDYDLLLQTPIRTVRESLRWHRLEPRQGRYFPDELIVRLRALRRRGMTGIWSVTQFGIPDWMDVWSSEFADAFAEFAAFQARTFRDECDDVPIWAPVNEISYWSWAGGSLGHFGPCAHDRGHVLKRQLASAAIKASIAMREIDPRARLLHIDPVVNIVPDYKIDGIDDRLMAQAGVFEAWDMLSGSVEPELGGHTDLLDLVGINFYSDNQRFADGSMVPFGHPSFVPFHRLAARVARRYRRPLLIAETGAEGPFGIPWIRYMAHETKKVAAAYPVAGMTIYPVMDYPGWADGRHCECGLIRCDPTWSERQLRADHSEAAAEAAELWGEAIETTAIRGK